MTWSIEALSVEVRYDSEWDFVTGEPISIDIKVAVPGGQELAKVSCSLARAEELAESIRQAVDIAKRYRKGIAQRHEEG